MQKHSVESTAAESVCHYKQPLSYLIHCSYKNIDSCWFKLVETERQACCKSTIGGSENGSGTSLLIKYHSLEVVVHNLWSALLWVFCFNVKQLFLVMS